jgi:hypothetical protein
MPGWTVAWNQASNNPASRYCQKWVFTKNNAGRYSKGSRKYPTMEEKAVGKSMWEYWKCVPQILF